MIKLMNYYNYLPLSIRKFISKHRLLNRRHAGYMCMISYDCEAGKYGAPNVKIYNSIPQLKLDHSCADNCGIVEVELKFKKVIKEGIDE